MKIALDENILVKDEICTAGSKFLNNFKSPYSATVADKVKNAGFTVSYKSKVGEFGAETEQNNAAYAVNSGLADVALGMDVDGAAYKSAVKNHVIYIKPTYGTVSRFGVVANVSSVDQIGVYAKNVEDGFAVLEIIAGYDKNDGTSYPEEKYKYSADGIDLKSLKIAEEPDFKLKEYLEAVYLILSAAEFSNNISRFDGLKYGCRTENFTSLNEMVVNSRSESFTVETKIKILMGAYVLSEEKFEKYYLKAAKIRRLIKEELDGIFEQTDIVILPLCDKAAALVNLTGCPALIINGRIIIAKEFEENKLFALGRSLQV